MILPLLRPDLEFLPGPDDLDGSPTVTLRDPLRGTFHKLGRAEAEVLRRLRRPCALPALLADLARATGLRPAAEEVVSFCRRAEADGLTVAGATDPARLEAEAAGPSWGRWLILNYLYIRVPLLKPDRWLEAHLPAVRRFFAPAALLCALAAVLGLALTLPRAEEFASTFPFFFTWQGALALAVTLAAIKALHEFAHGFAAKAEGIRVPRMGVVLMVLWPAAYCDVTDGWKLADRRARMRISGAGLLFELGLAGIALLGWNLADDGVGRSLCFLVSSATILSTLLVNLNPFLRFDGYYLLSDLWGVDNLQARAADHARALLRRLLWGLPSPPAPEPRAHAAFLAAFGIATWLWRLALYFGIALLVYHAFAKPLGILLFSVEIGWFILRPILQEAQSVRAEAKRFDPGRRRLRFALLALFLLWAVPPWPHRLELPCLAVPAQGQVLYAPEDGEIRSLAAADGVAFRQGAPLLRVEDWRLPLEERIAELETEILEIELRRSGLADRTRALLPQKTEEVAAARARRKALESRRTRSNLDAAVEGVVYGWDPTLREGRTVARGTVLGRLAHPEAVRFVAYVPEREAEGITAGSTARILLRSGGPALAGKVAAVHRSGSRILEHAELASTVSGDLPVRGDVEGRLILQQGYCRIDLECTGTEARFGETGSAWVRTRPRSLLAGWIAAIWRIAVRESGL